MKSQRRLITVGTLILLLSVVVQVAFALPPLPSSFYGTVKVDGVNVPAGTLVAAWIGGMKYAETIVSTFSGDTVYSLNVPGDDPATPGIIEGGNPGDTILFTIGSNPADQTGTWQSGANVQLNLSRAGAPVPASITVEVVPPVLIVNSGAAAVVTATVRDGSSQPIAGVLLSGSTIPSTLGAASLLGATNAAGQTIGTWTAGSVAGNGLLRASSGGVTGTAPITLNNTVPTLTSLSPMTVTMGSSSFTLTVSGTNFVNGSLIRWGGAPRTTVFISATQPANYDRRYRTCHDRHS